MSEKQGAAQDTPWRVYEDVKWPFGIIVVDAKGDGIMGWGRFAYSTEHKTRDDVMSLDGNVRQLERIRFIVACVNALAGLRPEAVRGLVEAADRRVDEGHSDSCFVTRCTCGHDALRSTLSAIKEKP